MKKNFIFEYHRECKQFFQKTKDFTLIPRGMKTVLIAFILQFPCVSKYWIVISRIWILGFSTVGKHNEIH